MARKLTQQEFEKKVKIKNPNLEILSEYKNSNSIIKTRCKKCGYEDKFKAVSLIGKEVKCKECGSSRLNTPHKILKMMEEKHPDVEILDNLSNVKTLKSAISCRCKKCGFEWKTNINNLKKSVGDCPCCSSKYHWTTEAIINYVKKYQPQFEVLGECNGLYGKIGARCKICGYEWEATTLGLIKNKYCPRCEKEKRIEDHILSYEDFMDRMSKIKNIKVIGGKYENANSIMKFKCLKCGHIWEAKATLISREFNGCPHCHISRGEERIEEFLKENKIKFEPQKKFDGCKDIHKLPFDFYLTDYNIAIEFDGKQHFEPTSFRSHKASKEEQWEKLRITKFHDKIKEGFCVFNNIKLIRIPYWDYNNIETILSKELNI